MKILIKNATTLPHLLGQAGDDFVNVNILVSDEKILKVSKSHITDVADKVFDGKDLFLSPGLCDPQVHFREPGLEYKEDIISGSKAAAKGGFTSVISMPNTTPTADNKEVVGFMQQKSIEIGICKVYPTGAVTMGLKGEELSDFAALKEAGAIAFTDDGHGVQKDNIFKAAMTNAKKLDMAVLDHSEDNSLSNGGCIHLGEISKKYNLKGIDSNSESVHVKRGCEFSEETGCHYHILHVSTVNSLKHVREAKAKGLNVTVEVSPHHLLLCDEDIPELDENKLNPNWKMNPPLRSKEDRAECVKSLLDGTIDAIATDHAPHAPHEKNKPIAEAPFGIIGLETAFPLIYTNFVKNGELSLTKCIDLMSKQAGALFKLEMGRIEVGAVADLVLFDLKSKFTITEDFFASKSKNSPFIGKELFGKTMLTICGGKISYDIND